MSYLSIADRELRLVSRKKRTYWVRLTVAAAAAATALGMLSPALHGLQPTTVIGARLFLVLSAAGLGFCLLGGAFITADTISAERRERSLELLALTELRGSDLIWGKALALALSPAYCVISALPVLALPVLWGGVTLADFWRMALIWLNSLFFSASVGMFVSSISWRGFRAVSAAFSIIIVIAIGPAVLIATSQATFSKTMFFSPAYAAYYAIAKHYVIAPHRFWLSLAATQLIAWAFLWLARSYVFRFHDEPPGKSKFSEALTNFGRKLHLFKNDPSEIDVNGHSERPENPILRWDTDPFQRGFSVWAFLIIASIAWFICYRQYRRLWLHAELVFGVTAFLHLILKGWLAAEATRRLSDARRQGELELLLVTPLTVDDIIRARMHALRRQFLLPVTLILTIDILLLLFGMKTAGWWGNTGLWALSFLVNIGLFVTDAYAITWVGLWQGLSARNTLQAFLRTIACVIALPWLIYIITMALLGMAVPAGTWAIGWWFAVGISNCFILCDWASRRLDGQFRIAASTVPA